MNLKSFTLSALALFIVGGCTNNRRKTTATPTATPVEIITMMPTATAKPYVAPPPEVRTVEFSPDRKWLAIGLLQWPDKGSITVRDCANNRVVKTWKVAGSVRHLAFSPDGKNLAMTSNADQFLVWNWKSGKLVHRAKTPRDETRAPLTYSSDGRNIAMALQTEGLLIYDTKTWKKSKLASPQHGDWSSLSAAIRFSPDGRWLVTSDGFEGYDGYTIYSLSGGKTRNIAIGSTWSEFAFSRDGRLLAGDIPDDNSSFVFTYDLRKSKLTRRFKSDDERGTFFTIQDFSPDARFLVGLRTNDKSGPVEIREIRNGKMVRQFKQTARVVAWLDNQTLLAGDENGVKRLKVSIS